MRRGRSFLGAGLRQFGALAVLGLCSLAVLGLCGEAARAQGGGPLPPEQILGKDDAQFALLLSRAGYPDLAEDVRNAIARSGGGAKALEASMLALELQQGQAYREPDSKKRIEQLQGLFDSRETFVAEHPNTPEAAAIEKGQLDLSRGIGELIAQTLQEGATKEGAELENAAELRKRGLEILEKAAKSLEARLEEEIDAEAEVDVDRMFAAYYLARTHYFRALLTEDEYARGAIARMALDVLLDFQLEYSDQLLCYEGFIYEGLCNNLTKEFESAIESFDAAISLRETYEQTAGVYQMPREAADIVSSAVLQKMILLVERGDNTGAVEAAEDFMSTTHESWRTLKGLAVLSQLADAYKAAGDGEGLRKTAKSLMDLDPYGPGGQRGREILGQGGGGSLGVEETLKVAESTAASDPERAIALCEDTLRLLEGATDQADMGSRTGLLLGALFAQRGWLHESVVAWDSAADRFAKGKSAPECMWRAINGYLTLQGQERRPMYKALAQERVNELLERYPEHTYATMAGLIEGQHAEAELDFARAAELYERIAPGAGGYEEALYRAGNAWLREAKKLFGERQTSGAHSAVKRAEAQLVKAQTALTEAASKTLEIGMQDRLRALAFSARVGLANLYLMPEVKRGAEVAALFEGMDGEIARDPTRAGAVWDLRFRALEAQGKRDEAMALLDGQIQSNPESSWVETGARILAPVLDKRAMELYATDPRSTEAEALTRKAAGYYQLAIRGQLQGRDAVQVDSLEGVADRLYVLGLRFSGVPDDVDSFVNYDGQKIRSDLVDLAVQAYETVLPLKPKDHRIAIKLARTLGFLARWETAAAHYADLFERESFANPVTKAIDQRALGTKPELLFAYLEWGVCEREVGVEQSDGSRLRRAVDIFVALVLGTKQGTKMWWQSKFFQLRTMVDLGDYVTADIALENLKDNAEHFDDGEFGLEKRFVALRAELDDKIR